MISRLYESLPEPQKQSQSSTQNTIGSDWSSTDDLLIPVNVKKREQKPPSPDSTTNATKFKVATPDIKEVAVLPEVTKASNFTSGPSPSPALNVDELANQSVDDTDIYDPSEPNNYEVIMKARAQAKRQQDIDLARKKYMSQKDSKFDIPPSDGSSSFSETNKGEIKKPSGSAESVGLRLMESMGWKKGDGLGKLGQGITAPLVAKKTESGVGVIVKSKEKKSLMKRSSSVPERRSNVLVLTNVVKLDQVDDDLKIETADEAKKHGNLVSIEVNTFHNLPEDEAVQIVLTYEKVEEAVKAFSAFNGRLFAGRTVKARFICNN